MSNQRGGVRIWVVGLVFCSMVLTNPTTVLAGPPEPPDITIEAIDVWIGPNPGNPSDPVVWNDQLFFSANAGGCFGPGLYGRELYTAGIGTGPILVKDINIQSGNCDGVSWDLHNEAAPLNGALIFRARPLGYHNTGFEPWRTQGTAGTTEIVRDIYFASNNSDPYGMATVFDGTHVAFAATHGFFGREPWVTDGTQAGTHIAGNIAVDDYDSDPYGFTALSSTQFVFIATDDDVIDHELFVSDGTTSTLLKDINPKPYDSSDPQFLTTFVGRDKVVFFAFEETAGSEPWVTDGTPGGTIRLADINPGPTSSNNDSDGDGDNAGFVQVGDQMYFSADDGATGRELWVTDGTPGGTHMVTEIVAGAGGGYFAHAAAFQNLLYFAAPGIGLWRSDGTPGGTATLVEGIFPSALHELTAVGDLLYFASSNQLWVSDGTVDGTVMVASFDPSYGAQALTAVNSSLLAFWAVNDAVGREMFLAYPTSLAPDTTGPTIITGFGPNPVELNQPGTLSATASEVNTGGANIADMESQVDGGPWVSMAPLDGAFDSPVETGLETVILSTLGAHQACVRGRDTLGNIGETRCNDIVVTASDAEPPPPPIVDVIPNPVMTGSVVTLTITASDVATGNNQIAFIEYQIDGGNWFGMSALDGFYDEPTEQARELLVFDDGGLIPVCGRALDDANNLSDPACVDLQVDAPDPTVRLRAIEVNQVIQNWRNEVPLDQMKDTVVRVFFEKADPQAANFANGFLHGSINGVPLPGSPLFTGSRANVGDDAAAFMVVDGGDSDSDPDDAIVSYRADLGNSLNYFLPSTWIDQGGTVDLEFELTSPTDGVLECAEPDGSPDCIVSVSFGSAERPIIEFFSVPYGRNEIRQIAVNATGGSYIFVSGNRESDPVPWDAGAGVIEDAVEDAIGGILDARDGRVDVYNGRKCGTTGTGVVYTIVILRGQSESLQVNDSGLAGSVSMLLCEAGGPTISPTFDDLREQARRVSDVFPSLGVDYRLRNLGGYNRAPTLLKVNNRLSKLRKIEKALGAGVPGMKSFALLLERGPTSTKAGMAWLNVSSTYSYDAEDPTDGGYSRSTGMHEGAHTYGRAHAVVFDQGALGSIGLCGSKYNDLASPLHPFVEDTGIENPPAATIDESLRYTWPTIGPLASGPDDEIWGFSPRAFENGSGFEHLVVVDPRMSAELMSYCNPPGNQQDRWVSSFSYDKLRTRLGNAKRSSADSAADFGFGDYLLVAGSIDSVTGEVEIEPAIRVSGLDPGDDPGELHVALVDGMGTEIASRDVALLIDGNHPSLSDGVGPEPMAFNAAIPIPDGSDPAGIVVTLDSTPIAQIMASANPPTVEITSPAAADAAVDTIPVAWTASDIDGDPLSTTILYSVDLGLTWQTLAVDVEGSTYDAPTVFLAGSNSALIRVLVSDGFHTTEATSNSFVVDAGYPTASIEIPANGVAVASDEILHLRGDAWDPEEGLLEGIGLSWTVDDGGPFLLPFAFGAEVDVPATQFTTGCQTFTLTATDSDGHTAFDSVEIDIGAIGCLGLIFADGFEAGDTIGWSSASP